MKRIVLLLVVGCAVLGVVSVWAARVQQPEAPNAHPSKIYGYISLRDPSTRQLHFTANPSNVIPTGVSVVFRSVDGVEQSVALTLGEITTTDVGQGQYREQQAEETPILFRFVNSDGSALDHHHNPRDVPDDAVAILYEITLEQGRDFGAPVSSQEATTRARSDEQQNTYPPVIQYNPEQWSYERVEIGQLEWMTPTGAVAVPVSKRSNPYHQFGEPR